MKDYSSVSKLFSLGGITIEHSSSFKELKKPGIIGL